MCRRKLFHYDLRVCTGLQVLSETRLWFYAYKKNKNGISARRTASQRHIRSSICYGGSDNFGSGISEKLPKITTSNAIFSRTADRIAAKFCMTIKKITSSDIFQNWVHYCFFLLLFLCSLLWHFKAYMKSYIPLETAAIFFSSEPISKTGY